MHLLKQSTLETGPRPAILVGGVALELHDSVTAAEEPWQDLENRGFSTVYQSLLWARTWQASDPTIRGRQPLIIVGRSELGEPLFVLPLQLRVSKGLKTLEFLSAPLASYGHLVCSPWCFSDAGRNWFDNHFESLLLLCEPFDLFDFRDMPSTFQGRVHPFSSQFNLRAPNTALTGHLGPSFDEFVSSKRGPDSRKNIRWRDSKLQQSGVLAFQSELAGEDLRIAADEMFADQGRRLEEAGIRDPFGEIERTFYHRLLASQTPNTQFKVMRLSIDGKGLSSIFAAFHHHTCSDLMTSLAQSPLRKYSPGDLVLRKVISHCCDKGFTHLDLGIGDHDYKRHWAEDELVLHHIVKGRTLKGAVAAGGVYTKQLVTRLIKGNRHMRYWFNSTRRYLRGRSSAVR
jgi:CelD/BcsL family acetyltransferase involved in cellulose biosynthesis